MFCRVLPLLLAFGTASSLPMQARPVDLQAPSGTLGSSDAMGFVETWEEVQDIDFGGGLTFPFRFGFTSKPDQVSPLYGRGWIVPLAESKAFMINETSMEVHLPCGKVFYLHCTRDDPTHFHSQNQEWQGTLNGDSFSFGRADNWMLRFEKGKLVEMKTDTGRDLVWTYNGDMLASVAEGSNRAFEVVSDVTGQPVGFRINQQSYSFKLDRRPMVENGPVGRVIGNLAPAMGTFTWPNGKSDTFKFSVADDLTPELTMIDAGGQKNTYTWDVAGHILSDNEWKYTVGDILPNSNLPALRRTNAQGQSEGVSIATRTGVITETNLQGVVTTTKIFRNPGPYFNKVREITQTTNGVTRVLDRRSYDEAGRLIRSMDESGTITTYVYDATGKLLHQAVTVDPKVLAQLQQQAAAMLKVIAGTTDLGQKNDLMEKLGFFYLFQMRDYAKATELAKIIPAPLTSYNVRLEAIFYNVNLTDEQKLAEYKKLLPLYPEATAGLNGIINDLQSALAQK